MLPLIALFSLFATCVAQEVAPSTPVPSASPFPTFDGFPPVLLAFSRDNAVCYICGEGFVISEEFASDEVSFPGVPGAFTCADGQQAGLRGLIPDAFCGPSLAAFFDPTCNCVANVTIAPASASPVAIAPSETPVAQTTPSPETPAVSLTPAPIMTDTSSSNNDSAAIAVSYFQRVGGIVSAVVLPILFL